MYKEIIQQRDKLATDPLNIKLQIINNSNVSSINQAVSYNKSVGNKKTLTSLLEISNTLVSTRVSMGDIINLMMDVNKQNPNDFNSDDYLLLDAIVHHCYSCDLVLIRSGVEKSYINSLGFFRELVYDLSEYSIWCGDGDKINGLVIDRDRKKNTIKLNNFKKYHADFWAKEVILKESLQP